MPQPIVLEMWIWRWIKVNEQRIRSQLLKAIEIAKGTEGWSDIADRVCAILKEQDGVQKGKLAAELSSWLYEAEDSASSDWSVFNAHHNLRDALVPYAKITWGWYQRGEL